MCSSSWFAIAVVLLLQLLTQISAFQSSSKFSSSSVSSTTSLQAFKWPALPTFTVSAPSIKDKIGERNGLDPDYPWRFEGRFIFRPSLVRISPDSQPPSSSLLSLFGYSLGGSVVLEYDISPVGPYKEYVTMGGVVGLGNVNIGIDSNVDKRILGIGQWGTNLYVSTQVAEDVCQVVWGVPAQVAEIEFVESGDVLADGPDDDGESGERKFRLSGWDNARLLDTGETTAKRIGNIPIYWTPTIKALWAPFLFPGGKEESKEQEELLPIHKLRLSASALRVKRCDRIQSKQEGEIPFGLALVVDNVLIEIGEQITAGNR